MSWFDALVLGALQGITEFLPISSSGHLVIVEQFFKLDVNSLKGFDVSLHVGTLLAILVYFRNDVFGMLKSFFNIILGRFSKEDPYARLILYLVIGTIPVVCIGFFGEDYIDEVFRNVFSVAITLVVVAVLFLFAEFVYKRINKGKITWLKAFIIGLFQAVALIPGVSRSGSTIIAGLFQGVTRSEAARFSFLLGIPSILGAGLLTFINASENFSNVGFPSLLFGFVSSFLVGLLSISFLMRFLTSHTLSVFAFYRIFVAALLFSAVFGGKF